MNNKIKIIIFIIILVILVYVSQNKQNKQQNSIENFSEMQQDNDYIVIKYILNRFLNFLEFFFKNLVEIRQQSNELLGYINSQKSIPTLFNKIKENAYKFLVLKKKYDIKYSEKTLEGIFFTKNINKNIIKNKVKNFNCSVTKNGVTKTQLLGKKLYCLSNLIMEDLSKIFENNINLYNKETYTSINSLSFNSDENYLIHQKTIKELFQDINDGLLNNFKDIIDIVWLFTNLKLNYKDILETNKLYIKNIVYNIEKFQETIKKIGFKDFFEEEILDILKNPLTGIDHLDIRNILELLFINNTEYHLFNVLNKILNNKYIIDRQKTSEGMKQIENVKGTLNNFIYTRLKMLHKKLNNSEIFKEEEGGYFNTMTNNFEIEAKFCKKLRLLNKPSTNSLRHKRFTDEIKTKKITFITKLEKQIEEINDSITNNDIAKYNTHKLRTHDQAKKQINAIKKSIENIKNKNKIKLNIV